MKQLINRKFIKDIILSIISASIPVVLMQIVLYPFIASKIGATSFGLLLTLIGISNIFSGITGNTLNNVRLLLDREYSEKHLKGDFNILLFSSLLISSIFLSFAVFYYEKKINLINIIAITVISIFTAVNSYISVEFRLKLDYFKIILSNIFLSAGYGIGFIIFTASGYWQVIFIIGSGLCLIYNLHATSILKEPFRKTYFFNLALKNYIILFFSIFISLVASYIDRWLLFPILGGEQVAIFYSASVIGKILSLVTGPIAGVLLSYIVKKKSISFQEYIKYIILLTLISIIGYFLGIIISQKIIYLIYPSWADKSLQYVPITVAICMLELFASMNNVIILKFKKRKWQIIIQISYFIFYFLLSIYLIKNKGLLGFCYASLFASMIKVIMMIFIGFFDKTK
jgi:O-antigen/teichoic acid export membrane protein